VTVTTRNEPYGNGVAGRTGRDGDGESERAGKEERVCICLREREREWVNVTLNSVFVIFLSKSK
jgi:hypothetical protein